MQDLHPPGPTTQILVCQMPVAQCQGLRRRDHRTEHKGHTSNPRTDIKIPDPALNQTRAARTLPTTPRRRTEKNNLEYFKICLSIH